MTAPASSAWPTRASTPPGSPAGSNGSATSPSGTGPWALVAAVEHFTGGLGSWIIEDTAGLDRAGAGN